MEDPCQRSRRAVVGVAPTPPGKSVAGSSGTVRT